MDHLIIFITAFLAATFALVSGFGLGTILTPVFIFFYDAKIAIFLVAVVHLLNNLFKLGLFRRHIQFEILKRFGFLAIVGAFIGAMGQGYLASNLLKQLVGILLIFLGVKEWFPSKYQFRFPKSIDAIGGFLSGLVGGLVGNQGVIRSAFLLNYDIPKEAFIATGVVIACLIDFIRVPIYWISYSNALSESWPWLILLVGFSFLGTLFGTVLLKRFSMEGFKKFVAGVIVLMGLYFLV